MDEKRKKYLEGLAMEFDIDLETVLMIADLLGPNEDYDGLVTSLEDYSLENEIRNDMEMEG